MNPSDTMVAVRETPSVRRWPEALRWGICLTVALSLHAAGAAALVLWRPVVADAVADAPVILVELAAIPVSPDVTKTQLPPGPQQAESVHESEPQELADKVETQLDQVNEAELTATQSTPAEKQKKKQPKRTHASVATAPSSANLRAVRAMAPAPGASSQNPDALPSWRSALVARLERYKRYPPEAQSRGEAGTAQLAFSIDRNGGVHHAHIVRSSGSSLLDREALALPERASPMPTPPPDVPGAQIPIIVPIRYNAR
ncbi:MAG: TonB family protein [Hyphomicrobiales bacterium]